MDDVAGAVEVLTSGELVVRFAGPSEAELVSSVLREASDWLARRGEALWAAADLTAGAISEEVAAGNYILAWVGDNVAGTARLTLTDPQCWPDVPSGDALYLHRLAVRRAHAGGAVSSQILRWSALHARALGRRLRLDCDAGRPRLRRVYEDFGFVFHSERRVGVYTVARYELR